MPHTLLLADDSVTIQRVIELTFADEDVNVVAVSDGDQAIAQIDAHPPDIVLADIGMPGKNGYEVAQHVRRSPRLQHIPVLLLTGAFEPVDQLRAAEAGCDGVLAKPFEPQQVIGRVRELLARTLDHGDLETEAIEPPEHVPAATDLWPVAAAAQASAPSLGEPAAGASATDHYFDQLDAAFAKLTGAPAAAAPPISPLTEQKPARVADEIDWFASQLNPPSAPGAEPFDLPGPAATEPIDDLPLTVIDAPAGDDLDLMATGAEVLGAVVLGAVPGAVALGADAGAEAGAEVAEAGAEVPGAKVPGAVQGAEVLSAPAPPLGLQHEAPQHAALHPAQHSAPSTPALQHPVVHPAPHPAPSTAAPQHPLQSPQHPIALPSITDAFAALLAAEANDARSATVPVWPVASAPLPESAPPAPAPPALDLAALVEQVTRRVLDHLSETVIREAVADVTSTIAERVVREEIDRIKSAIK